jgi:hypothetical protein
MLVPCHWFSLSQGGIPRQLASFWPTQRRSEVMLFHGGCSFSPCHWHQGYLFWRTAHVTWTCPHHMSNWNNLVFIRISSQDTCDGGDSHRERRIRSVLIPHPVLNRASYALTTNIHTVCSVFIPNNWRQSAGHPELSFNPRTAESGMGWFL